MGVETITSGQLDYVLIPHRADWTREPEFSRTWKTTSAQSLSGRELRSRLRLTPVAQLKWTVTTSNEAEEARLEARVIAAKLTGRAAAPWLGRGMTVVSAASGSHTITVNSSPWFPLAGDWVILLLSSDLSQPVYDVGLVTSAGGGTITIAGTLSRTWAAGSLCYPLIVGDFSLVARAMQMGKVATWDFAIEYNTEPDDGGAIQVDGYQGIVASLETYAAPWGPYIQVDGFQAVVAGHETYAVAWEDAVQVDGFQAVVVVEET